MIIQIKPKIEHSSNFPKMTTALKNVGILWQGIQICVKCQEVQSSRELIQNMPVGHAVIPAYHYQVDLETEKIVANDSPGQVLARSLIDGLNHPQTEAVKITKEVFHQCQRVIILNCLDYLYGHSLKKLLNAERHLEYHKEYGLVVIVPHLIRWMVPPGVAEIWSVHLPLKKYQSYYPSFEKFVLQESDRFSEIYVSQAYTNPSHVDITKFTQVPQHRFDTEEFKITFIWREDRIWCDSRLHKILKKLNLLDIMLPFQNWKIRTMFQRIRKRLPLAKFAVAGLGRKTKFPDWIEDRRVDRYDEKTERETCQLYSESRLAIGVHGSNLLLPSAHAGMTIDLMPERWGNFAQDILYQESDPKLAAFRYRYVPIQTSMADIALMAASMILKRSHFYSLMNADKSL